MKKNYSQEQQKEIIKMYSSGVTVREYINYYNNDRPHSVLRYQTPEYFESKYYRSIDVYKESESNTGGSNLEK